MPRNPPNADQRTKLRGYIARARRILRDFHPISSLSSPRLNFRTVSHGNYDPPTHIVALLIFAVLDLEDLGGADKIRWQAVFEFRNVAFLIRDYKFGSWSLESETHDDSTGVLVEHIKRQLRLAAMPADEVLKDILQQEILRGNYHLNNVYFKLESMFAFFRDRVKASMRMLSHQPVLSPPGTPKRAQQLNQRFKKERELSYLAFGMASSFFSLLEFLLAAIYALDQGAVSYEEYLRLDWREQFKALFRVKASGRWKAHYDRLRKIKESIRNPLEHGLLGDANLLVPLPWGGLVPISYQFALDKMQNDWAGFGITLADAANLVEAMDRFFQDLRGIEPYRSYCEFVESHFPVPIKIASVRELQGHMADREHWLGYLEWRRSYADAVMNRDI